MELSQLYPYPLIISFVGMIVLLFSLLNLSTFIPRRGGYNSQLKLAWIGWLLICVGVAMTVIQLFL